MSSPLADPADRYWRSVRRDGIIAQLRTRGHH